METCYVEILASPTTSLQPICFTLKCPCRAKTSVFVFVCDSLYAEFPGLPDEKEIGTQRQYTAAMKLSKQTG